MHQVNDTAESVPRRQIGHQHVCVVCGRSISRISRRRVLIDTANEQEQRLAHIISTWIQPQEVIKHVKIQIFLPYHTPISYFVNNIIFAFS